MRPQSPATMPWLDRLAIGASATCFVHCLLLPVALAALPTAAQTFQLGEDLHLYAFAAAVPISALAMRRGYRRHGLLLPAALGLGGLALLGVGALVGLRGALETGFTLAGSAVLALAHLRNWQLRRRGSAPPRSPHQVIRS
jgi:MerC mercury resistance protein